MNKKFCYILLLAVIAALSASCSVIDSASSADVTLPDSLKMPGVRPELKGNLNRYIRVVNQPYVFHFTDSLSYADVLLKLVKKYEGGNFSSFFVQNPEDALSEVPYIELIDDMYQPIPGVVMEMDSSRVSRIRSLMRGDLQAEIEVRFKCHGLSDDAIDSIRMYAANFRVVANYTTKVDEKRINTYLDEFEQRIEEHNRYASMGAAVNEEPHLSLYRASESRLDDIKGRIKRAVPFMTPEQKAQYEGLRKAELKVKARKELAEEDTANPKDTKVKEEKAKEEKAEAVKTEKAKEENTEKVEEEKTEKTQE